MSTIKSKEYDVVVVGGGNAGMCAALSARESGGSVLVVEKAPQDDRGGNSKYADLFRFTYNDLKDVETMVLDMTEEERKTADIVPYTTDQYYNDIMRLTLGRADPEIAEIVVNYARPTTEWLLGMGVEHQLNYLALVRHEGKLTWQPGLIVEPKGGGPGLVDALFKAAEEKGVEVAYETTALKLLMDSSGRISGIQVKTKNGLQEITAKNGVILASGGFEASAEMRGKYMAPGLDIIKVRGTQYNTGEGLTMAIAVGAKTTGEWSGAHATQIDANAADFDQGDATFRASYQYSIMVNIEGKRFVDEAADFQMFTYARLGKEVLRQPNGWAAQIFNQKETYLLDPTYNVGTPPIIANTLEELAENLGIVPENLVESVAEYNSAVQETDFDPGILDGKRTDGIDPPKSNWAVRLDTPPFVAYPVSGGITFTYGGLKINKYGQVLDTANNAILGLYATGEIHGFFYHNYPGATGLMRGSIFGRIGGAHAMGHKLI